MAFITASDFSVKTKNENKIVRDKLNDLGKELVIEASIVCPNYTWDNYVTEDKKKSVQWGAIYPTKVKGNKDIVIGSYPGISFDIPQNGDDAVLLINIEFSKSRQMLENCCVNSKIGNLVQRINQAINAEVIVVKKEVPLEMPRDYKWTKQLWDNSQLPIMATQCNATYINDYVALSKQHKQHPNPNVWKYEPVLLIKYQFDPSKLAGIGTINSVLTPGVRLLAPILEYITYN